MASCSAKGGENVNGEAVSLREVNRYELDTRLHERRDEVNITRQPIEFGDDDRCAVQTAKSESFGDGGSVVPFAALVFDYLPHQRPASAVEVAEHSQ